MWKFKGKELVIRKPSHKYRQKYSVKHSRGYIPRFAELEDELIGTHSVIGLEKHTQHQHQSALSVLEHHPRHSTKDQKICSQSLENFEI
jgi:phage regulator Rha-like protein